MIEYLCGRCLCEFLCMSLGICVLCVCEVFVCLSLSVYMYYVWCMCE